MNARAHRPLPGTACVSSPAPGRIHPGGRGQPGRGPDGLPGAGPHNPELHGPGPRKPGLRLSGRAPGLWWLPLLALAQAALWPLAEGTDLRADAAGVLWGGMAALGGLLGGAWALRQGSALRPGGVLAVGLLAQALAAALTGTMRVGLESHPAWLLLLPPLLLLATLLLLEGRLLADALFTRAFHRRLPALPAPAGAPEPRVSVHLPTQDHPAALLRDTLDHLAELDYGALEVLVLDTSGSPERWEPVAEHCARLGPRFRFFHLGAGQEAAARDFALRETAPDAALVATLEPGCRVQPDWLRRTVPFFREAGLGFVQAAGCAPERGAPLADRLAHATDSTAWPRIRHARNEHRAAPLRASLALIRREALLLAGGWGRHGAAPAQPAELGLRLLRQGWDGLALADGLASGHGSATPRAGVAELLASLRRHGAALLNPRHRALAPGQSRHLLAETAAATADAAWLALAVLALPWTLALLAARELPAAPTLAFLLPALALPLLRLAQAALLAPAGHRALAALAALAAMPGRGAAFWGALLGHAEPSIRRPHRMLSLLLALLGGAAVTFLLGGLAEAGWAGVLLLLAAPCAAALLLRGTEESDAG